MSAEVGEMAPGFILPKHGWENGVSPDGMEFSLLADFKEQTMKEYSIRHEDTYQKPARFNIDREGVESSNRDKPGAVLEDLDRVL